MKFYLLIAVSIVWSCTPTAQSSSNSDGNSKILRLQDWTYEPEIKTVTLHGLGQNAPQAGLFPAVTRLGDWNLTLEFDDLRTGRDSYYAKIIHCNYDWRQSGLQDLDFMNEFNEFPILNFEYSVDSHISYLHYWFKLPAVKLPGNYVLAVYRGGDKNDLLLTKRFMVYTSQVGFEMEQNLIGAGSVAALNQQINFTIGYDKLEVINPMETMKVSIRQNHRWDNMAMDVKASFVREIEKQMEYRFFDESKMFKGGNEFRFFDFRSLISPGRNVASVAKTVKPFELYLTQDRERSRQPYAQYDDLNGGFIIENLDYRNIAYANYANVHFSLKSRPLQGDVFVVGGYNYWNLNDENRMSYDSAQGQYSLTALLKQGWYDYQYLVRQKDGTLNSLEGSHYQTENSYEIFIYYRPFRPNADLLVGYVSLEKNPR
jgi:hypothetical protein